MFGLALLMLDGLLHRAIRRKGGSIERVEQERHQHVFRGGVSLPERQEKLSDRTLRCRHELKYGISESKVAAIEQFIKPYLHLDHYCKLQPSGVYPIVSLYLDSDDFRLFRQTLEGQKNRFKLRVRSYTDKVDYPRFFEIKRRMNSIIMKSRARVMHDDVAKVLCGLYIPDGSDEETLRQFQLYAVGINARPVMRIRYMRRAYEGDSENRIRITFDSELAYCAGNEPEVRFEGRRWQRYNLRGAILEIKFTGRFPVWLSQMARYFDLSQQSVSKYVSSIKQSCSLGFCAPRLSVG